MKNRIKMLKVKIKSLSEESRIIRLEEARSRPGSQQQSELHQHRVMDVRREQRCSLLAYAFLRGVPLSRCEARSRVEPDWKRIGQIVEKFGAVPGTESRAAQLARLDQWRAGANVEVA